MCAEKTLNNAYIWLVLTLKDPMAGSPVLLALLGAAGLGVPFSLESVPWLEADLAVWDMVEEFCRPVKVTHRQLNDNKVNQGSHLDEVVGEGMRDEYCRLKGE